MHFVIYTNWSNFTLFSSYPYANNVMLLLIIKMSNQEGASFVLRVCVYYVCCQRFAFNRVMNQILTRMVPNSIFWRAKSSKITKIMDAK